MTNRFDPGKALHFSAQAATLTRELPTQFVAEEIDFAKAPWLEVTYAYRLQPLVSLSALPEPMRQELLWWLHSLHAGGERVDAWRLQALVKLAAAIAADPKRGVSSFAALSVSEWMAAARRQFHDRNGRLPGTRFEHSHRPPIARLHAALVRAYAIGEWWRADAWEPRYDPRIPVREHEARGNTRLDFASVPQVWLRRR